MFLRFTSLVSSRRLASIVNNMTNTSAYFAKGRRKRRLIRGGSRIFEGGVAGVEYGRAPKAPVAERRRRELLGGSGGMPSILKSQVSEMAFPAF